jgi:NADH-quinone oxidoreductase subunit J
MERALFVIFAVTAIGAALNVLVRRHPLHSALALLVVLGALTGLYVLLGAYFLAVIQVVIYAGAVLVLFLFVIMLLNVRAEEARIERRPYLRWLAIPFAALLGMEIISLVRVFEENPSPSGTSVGVTEAIGRELLTTYLLPFEVTSILILIAVLGAVVLARRERR